MALITNNISGSSRGNSTVGITGSIIVSRPGQGGSYPQLHGSNTLLQVSGSRAAGGTETPNVFFSGDTFVSGGFGVSDYLQLKTVDSLSLPPNNGSSFIYTSGSNHDLYFQQRHGTDVNATRLRWLEGSLSTGLLHGGVLSTSVGGTTFKITAGSGIVVTMSASLTTDPYPKVKYVEWADKSDIPLQYVNTDQITYVALDHDTQVLQQTSPYTNTDYYDKIVLGRVLHQWSNVTNGVISSPSVAYGINQSNEEFVRAFGPLKLTGHYFEASGSAPTMELKKTAGKSYVTGRNYTSNPDSPNLIQPTTDLAPVASKIFREYIDSTGKPVIDSNGGVGYTVVDPNQWNNNGTLSGVQSNRFTIQRVYWFPNSVNKAFFVYYGVKEYQTLAEAQVGISNENFVEGENTAGAAIFLGWIIVKNGTTNLLNTSDAKIIQAGLFRNSSGGGAGGGSVLTNPGGASTNVQFNDAGYFGGDSQFTFNKTTHTLGITNVSATSITGSLTQLQDGSAYLVASSSGNMAQAGGISISTGSNGQVSASYYVFPSDIVMSVPSGYFGQYSNDSTIPAKGKTPAELIMMALVVPQPATIELTPTTYTIPFNHAGMTLNNITATYTLKSGANFADAGFFYQETATSVSELPGEATPWVLLSSGNDNPNIQSRVIANSNFTQKKHWFKYAIRDSNNMVSTGSISYSTRDYVAPTISGLNTTLNTAFYQRYTSNSDGEVESFTLRAKGNVSTKLIYNINIDTTNNVNLTSYQQKYTVNGTTTNIDTSAVTITGKSYSLTNPSFHNPGLVASVTYKNLVSDQYQSNTFDITTVNFKDVIFFGLDPNMGTQSSVEASFNDVNTSSFVESLPSKKFITSETLGSEQIITINTQVTHYNWIVAIPNTHSIDMTPGKTYKKTGSNTSDATFVELTSPTNIFTYTPVTRGNGYSMGYKIYKLHVSVALTVGDQFFVTIKNG